MINYYTGIGSRETPTSILTLMPKIAYKMYKKDYILRSGGANGADSAFDLGYNQRNIYLPWNNFNNLVVDNINYFCEKVTDEVKEFVFDYHPNSYKLSNAGLLLMARNTFQVLGSDLKTPAKVVICYTADGKASGGTGQAIRIATDYKIPVVNLFNEVKSLSWLRENLKISI